jgi:hypothetical protein
LSLGGPGLYWYYLEKYALYQVVYQVLLIFHILFFSLFSGEKSVVITADSRRHDPPFSETGSWKLEVGSWI